MPWKGSKALDQRIRFIEEWEKGGEDVAELCRRYGISRQTGYKWAKRHAGEGLAGLAARRRAPHHRPPALGPRTLRARLETQQPHRNWPAPGTIGDLLSHEGLTHPRRTRRRTPPYSAPLAHAQAPNQVWCADYKGWFYCGDGQRCDPLTLSDTFSRYLPRCRVVSKTDGVEARAVFEAVFREYGLPAAIRSDNGPPFASKAPAGLSRLSLWWPRLGIRHERIEPGCPQQNGRHERMHPTLKQETASPPRANLRQQQQAFQRFQREYNQERPHQALDYRTPGQLYVASARPYPARPPELEYPPGVPPRRITRQGSVKWKGGRAFVREVLGRDQVGLLEVDEDVREVYYGKLLLGWLDASANEPLFVADPGPPKATRRKKRTAAGGRP